MTATVPQLEQLAERMGAVSDAWRDVVAVRADATAFVDAGTPLGPVLAAGVETIREGWLLHRGASRVAPGASPDLALLVGDWCYAAGLCEVARAGTLEQVAVLADLVADVAARADESFDALDECWARALDALA